MCTFTLFIVWQFALPARAADPPVRPAIVELSPAASRPADVLTLDIDRYRWFGLDHYAGRVTWKVDGAGVGTYQTAEPTLLLGALQGTDAVAPQKVPAGALVVWGRQPGPVTLVAWGVVDGAAVELDSRKLLVGRTPPPVPPLPTDPLFARLLSAYAADGSPADCAARLASCYGAAARVTVDDGSLKTTGALLAAMRRSAEGLCPLPALKAVREVLAGELDTCLGTNPAAPLDPAARAVAREQFARLAVLIGGLK